MRRDEPPTIQSKASGRNGSRRRWSSALLRTGRGSSRRPAAAVLRGAPGAEPAAEHERLEEWFASSGTTSPTALASPRRAACRIDGVGRRMTATSGEGHDRVDQRLGAHGRGDAERATPTPQPSASPRARRATSSRSTIAHTRSEPERVLPEVERVDATGVASPTSQNATSRRCPEPPCKRARGEGRQHARRASGAARWRGTRPARTAGRGVHHGQRRHVDPLVADPARVARWVRNAVGIEPLGPVAEIRVEVAARSIAGAWRPSRRCRCRGTACGSLRREHPA